MSIPTRTPLSVFIVAGEESGDLLGSALMQALSARCDGHIRFAGVGGSRMQTAGLQSLFAMDELALHGFTEVIARLPRLMRLMRQTATAVAAQRPDVVILVDAPAFNVRLARRVRAADPSVPIVDYVSPTVWAHNAWRARRMAPNIDEILAILPFEPAVHRELGGPRCVYVGHPLLERLTELRPAPGERPVLGSRRPMLLVLPGSRRSEIARLMQPFGEAVALIKAAVPDVELVLPAVPRLLPAIETAVASWPVKPAIVSGEESKLAAFRRAHAALAASGTVTLELALSGVPMAVAYRLDPLVKPFKWLLRSRSVVLPNVILDENVIEEFIDRDSTPERLAAAIVPLLGDTPERRRQLAAFARLDTLMRTDGRPAELAAAEVMAVMERKRPVIPAAR